jgi:hypothetical protein
LTFLFEELGWLFDRFEEQGFNSLKVFSGLILADVYKLRKLLDGIETPRRIRHVEINAVVPVLSDHIVGLEVRSLGLGTTSNIEELRSPTQ